MVLLFFFTGDLFNATIHFVLVFPRQFSHVFHILQSLAVLECISMLFISKSLIDSSSASSSFVKAETLLLKLSVDCVVYVNLPITDHFFAIQMHRFLYIFCFPNLSDSILDVNFGSSVAGSTSDSRKLWISDLESFS